MRIENDTAAFPVGLGQNKGMTIRTAIAKDVLASIVGSQHHTAAINEHCSADGEKMVAMSARIAVMYADALIAELNARPEEESGERKHLRDELCELCREYREELKHLDTGLAKPGEQ